jgi:peptide deformylase
METMTVSTLKIIKYPHEVLKMICEPVTEFGHELHMYLDQMPALMESENGMGLAANQVGIIKRFFIMKDKKGNLVEFINPEIIDKDGNQQINEGCLSAPGVTVQVPRSQSITVKAQNRNGEEFIIMAVDLEAVCIQHEIDHLNGVFFLEKVNRQQRRAALSKLGLK